MGLELAQNMVSLQAMRRMAGIGNKQEANDTFAALKIVVKQLFKASRVHENTNPQTAGLLKRTQHILGLSFDRFYTELFLPFTRQQIDQPSDLDLAIVKNDLAAVKKLIADAKNHLHKEQAKNLYLHILKIQALKIDKRCEYKTTPLTMNDLCEQDLIVLEIAKTTSTALGFENEDDLLFQLPPHEFYQHTYTILKTVK